MQPEKTFDKRTLLAFALMFVVWVGWSVVFPPKRSTETETPPPPTAVEAEIPPEQEIEPLASESRSPILTEDRRAELAGPASGWQNWEESEHGETIRIVTNLYEAELDLVGADLRSWVLKDYDLVDGSPVQLVNGQTVDLGGQSAHALRLIFEGQASDLRRVRFESEQRQLVLDETNPEGSLQLRARREDGAELVLDYRFHVDRYGFEVRARYVSQDIDRIPVSLEVGWPGGLAASEPDASDEYREFKAAARVGADIHKVSFGDLTKGDGSKGHRVFEGTLSWAAAASKYFVGAVVAADPKPGFVRLGGDAGAAVQSFDAKLQLHRDRESFVDYAVYLGPLQLENLRAYDQEPYQAQVSKLVDLGPAIFRPVASLTLSALELLYAVIPNWGLVIIIFSSLTKLLFYPLTKSSTESMKRMQEVQPKLQKLREKYKDEPQRLNSEMLRIYKEEKINPLGGCLPLLVQMPVFYALFTILRKTIGLRQADFVWWMDDLSRPDALFQLPVSLPLFGTNVNVLPVLMAAGMWWQTKLSQPKNGAPTDGGSMAAQMRMMSTVMPLMMFVLFYNSPSGLVLYWLVNTVLTALQTWQIHSKMSPSPKTENPQPA